MDKTPGSQTGTTGASGHQEPRSQHLVQREFSGNSLGIHQSSRDSERNLNQQRGWGIKMKHDLGADNQIQKTVRHNVWSSIRRTGLGPYEVYRLELSDAVEKGYL